MRKKALDQLIKDAQSKDPERRKEAREILKDMIEQSKDKNGKDANGDKLTKDQKKSLEEIVKDKEFNTPEMRKKALEELAKKAQSKDPERRKEAQEILKDVMEKSKEDPGNQDPVQKEEKLTKEEMESLQKLLKGNPPESASAKKKTMEDLKRIVEKSKDPEVRQKAEDLLKDLEDQSKFEEARKKSGLTKKDVEEIKKYIKKNKLDQSENREKVLKDLKELAKKAKDRGTRKAAEDIMEKLQKFEQLTKKGKGNSGSPGNKIPQENNKGILDKSTKFSATKEFAEKGGVLQLEELKKMLTPENLRKMNWTKEQAQEFLRQAQEYAQRRNNTKQDLKAPGSIPSLLPSQGPRRILSPKPEENQPLESGRRLPPPELDSIYRRLTSGQRKKN